MRSLASIQRIHDIMPIEGADKIELAKVLGWQVVVKKDQFKVGDLCCYIEIDAIVPQTPLFEFMKKYNYHVKTIKLRGVISQGLILPLDDLGLNIDIKEGMDITDILGIQKWEPPETIEKTKAVKQKSLWNKIQSKLPFIKIFSLKEQTDFPTHLVPKTDEIRLQALGEIFLKTYKDIKISISEKVDGKSATFILYKRRFSVASRNIWFHKENDSDFWHAAKQINIIPAMKKVFKHRNVALQGELCGPKIQGNRYKLEKLHFYLFNIFDIDKREYFTPQELYDAFTALKMEGSTIEIVPQFYTPNTTNITIGSIGVTIDSWLQFADGKSTINPSVLREGVVIRSIDNKPYNVKNLPSKRFSFKVVSNKYLLQYNL